METPFAEVLAYINLSTEKFNEIPDNFENSRIFKARLNERFEKYKKEAERLLGFLKLSGIHTVKKPTKPDVQEVNEVVSQVKKQRRIRNYTPIKDNDWAEEEYEKREKKGNLMLSTTEYDTDDGSVKINHEDDYVKNILSESPMLPKPRPQSPQQQIPLDMPLQIEELEQPRSPLRTEIFPPKPRMDMIRYIHLPIEEKMKINIDEVFDEQTRNKIDLNKHLKFEDRLRLDKMEIHPSYILEYENFNFPSGKVYAYQDKNATIYYKDPHYYKGDVGRYYFKGLYGPDVYLGHNRFFLVEDKKTGLYYPYINGHKIYKWIDPDL